MSQSDDQPSVDIDVQTIQQYLLSRRSDQEQLGRLEATTERLSADTQALTVALETYATKDAVESIEENQVKRDKDHAEKRLADLVKLRKKIRAQSWIIAAVTVVLIAISGLYFRHAFNAYKHDRFNACTASNAAKVHDSDSSKKFFAPLLAKEQNEAHSDPVVLYILQSLATSTPQLSRCVR